jgi:hypothetical protein
MPRSPLAVLALAAALLAGCGGGGGSDDDATSTAAGSSPAETGEAPEPDIASVTEAAAGADDSTVTVDPEPVTQEDQDAPRPPFPAPDAAGVVALALQQPAGRVVYDVAFPEGSYVLTLANDGERGLVHQSQDTGDVWIGADLGSSAISFFCTALPDAPADCRSGDPDGTAVATARELAAVVGTSFIQATFGPVAALPEVQTGTDQQVDHSVSCLAASVEGNDLRLCVTEEGYVTEIRAGGTRALAREIVEEVDAGELEPPAEPR